MKALKEKLEQYLLQLSEGGVVLSPEQGKELPLILRERFNLFHVRLFDREWLLAIEAKGWDAGTPTEYRDQAGKLASALGKPVVLVLAALSGASRNRLVQMNVPFIVPASQIFLPVSMINLREVYPRQGFQEGKSLSPTGQVLVIYQILNGGLDALSSKQIAQLTGYSEMGISKARSELEANQLCEVKREGRESHMRFPASARELWEKAMPLLGSPVQKRHWVQWGQAPRTVKRAGISALSEQSSLADDAIPVFALKKQAFKALLEQAELHGCSDRFEADACVEAWKYDPALLSDGDVVDSLSLFLSLRNNPDERVQGALADMMEEFSWR